MEKQTHQPTEIASLWFESQREIWENSMKSTLKGVEAAKSVWQGQKGMDMLTAWQRAWSKSLFEPLLGKEPIAGLAPTVYDRLLQASIAYNSLLVFWARSAMLFSQLAPGTAPTTERLKETYDQWVEEYQAVMGSLWGAYPSKDAEETAKAHQSAIAALAEHGWRFMEPLLKNLEQLPEILAKIAKGDAEASVELTGLFRKNYELTLGRALRAPSLGYAREFTQTVNETLDAYVHYNAALAQYFAPFHQSGMRAAEKVYERLSEFKTQEITPESFREFYRIWWTTNEEIYHQMFGSEEFTRLLGEVLREGLLFKKHLDNLSDEVTQFTNLPTKKDMDEIYKTIYDLRKEVRWQRRAIRDLEQQLGIAARKPGRAAK